jgi:deoxyribodipyrimidine photo-lyase
MNRDQRVNDNWALLYAFNQAQKNNQLLIVLFVMMNEYLGSNNHKDNRHYEFMKRGLKKVEIDLTNFNIPLIIIDGEPEEAIVSFINQIKPSVLVTDFHPLRLMKNARTVIAESIDLQMIEVDAHNIVPAYIVSSKQEWGAYTLRPKIKRLLPEYLTEFPKIYQQKYDQSIIANDCLKNYQPLNPEEELNQFIAQKLADYHLRNNPNLEVTSKLSKYLHFGQISAQRIALEVMKSNHPSDAFLEELIVRRELADNYCFYNDNYDNFNGYPDWAKKTLNNHRSDKREYIYDIDQFESYSTHDDAWNACQKQMVDTGYMHGYMRMYWAKKILEWTPDPETAIKIAIYLNDKYQLDGRDPNGYTGIAWAIGGVHDRPWSERQVFGSIRYMNQAGLKRKFDIEQYIDMWLKDKEKKEIPHINLQSNDD